MKKILSLVSFAWLFIAGAHAAIISVQDISLNAGETITVNISLNYSIYDDPSSSYVGFQMDLTLPAGISINKAGCSLSNRFNDPDQTLTIGKLSDNVYRLTSTSFALKPISGTMGTLLTISLTAAADSKGGKATISNIIFASNYSRTWRLDNVEFNINVEGGTHSLGDVNGDGSVGAADVSAMINNILKRPNLAFIFSNADMNGDGTISATDVSALINVILHKN